MRPQDHAGRAETALQAMHHAEAFLQRAQCPVGIGHTFDRGDIGAVGLDREGHAALDRHVVHLDGAGAAMAGVATDMSSGEILLFAQEVDQQGARLDQRLNLLAVDGQFDV